MTRHDLYHARNQSIVDGIYRIRDRNRSGGWPVCPVRAHGERDAPVWSVRPQPYRHSVPLLSGDEQGRVRRGRRASIRRHVVSCGWCRMEWGRHPNPRPQSGGWQVVTRLRSCAHP